jgi:ribosomal protein L13
MSGVKLTITLTGRSASEVAEELRQDLEDHRDCGDYEFDYEVDEASA